MQDEKMKWLEWARELQAISQAGLHYTDSHFEQERYAAVGRIAAEIMSQQSNLTVSEAIEINKQEFGYATPKVDVRGVVFKEGKILLIQEILDEGRWTLPGGWADVNETPSEAVVREIYEESGFETRVLRLLAVYDREKQGHQPPFPVHVYKLFFHCAVTGGEARVNMEASDVGFFEKHELPELSVSRVKKEQIYQFFTQAQDAGAPTLFD